MPTHPRSPLIRFGKLATRPRDPAPNRTPTTTGWGKFIDFVLEQTFRQPKVRWTIVQWLGQHTTLEHLFTRRDGLHLDQGLNGFGGFIAVLLQLHQTSPWIPVSTGLSGASDLPACPLQVVVPSRLERSMPRQSNAILTGPNASKVLVSLIFQINTVAEIKQNHDMAHLNT